MDTKACLCGGRAEYQNVRIDTAWGDGPRIEVLTKGWKCLNCHEVIFDMVHVREIQNLAYNAFAVDEEQLFEWRGKRIVWLEAENARLKDSNREMVGALKDVLYYQIGYEASITIRELLAKVEGEGE